jgi:hypothetical protein
MHPRPPSIDINTQTIARHAVERLFWRMKNGLSSPSVVVTVSPTLNGDSAAADEKHERQPVAAALSAASLSRRTVVHREVHSDGNGVGVGDGDGNGDGDGAAHAL